MKQAAMSATGRMLFRGIIFGLGLMLLSSFLLASNAVTERNIKRRKLQEVSSSEPTAPNASRLQNIFPKDTLLKAQQYGSPQARAYRWMLADMDQNPNLSDHRIRQRFSLTTFYFATNGEQWKNNDYWIQHDVHECSWFSQKEFANLAAQYHTRYLRQVNFSNANPCEIPNKNLQDTFLVDSGDASIRHLWLQSNYLSGSLPEELYWLTNLKSISLYNNRNLEGTISSSIGKLSDLMAINIARQPLAGTIPTELGLLSNSLRIINLANTKLHGSIPSELANLALSPQLLLDVQDEQSVNFTLSYLPASFVVKGTKLSGKVPAKVCGNAIVDLGTTRLSCPGQRPHKSTAIWMSLKGQKPSRLSKRKG